LHCKQNRELRALFERLKAGDFTGLPIAATVDPTPGARSIALEPDLRTKIALS
jgi:hypothetical protein